MVRAIMMPLQHFTNDIKYGVAPLNPSDPNTAGPVWREY